MSLTPSGLTCTRRLGAGGEAEVYEVAERPGLAFKRYRQPTTERAAKLRVMVATPPDGTDAGGHVAIAWPTELVCGRAGDIEGFLMPRIDLAATVPLFQVYNPSSRVQIAPAFTWRYLLRTARNVAAIVDSLHRAGYVVGDINESNLLVNRRALAVLVDCDSMQVRDPATGFLHRGGVGKPEFTAPELHGRDLAATDRSPATDDFAVAVLVFQLLMEGVHPFAGIWQGRGEPPDVAARIRAGHFAYRRGARVTPPPHALALDVLPPDLRKLAWRAFTTGLRRPGTRPTSAAWADALERADTQLRTCDRSPHHVFGSHRRRCPWCARIDAGFPDPFPGPSGQSPLTPRPPSRWTVVKTRAAAAVRSASTRMGRAAASGARRATTAMWALTGPPLRGTVPRTLAIAAVGAGAPVAALFAMSVHVAFLAGFRRGPRLQLARHGGELAGAAACGIAALAIADQGPMGGSWPPWPPTVAAIAGAMAVVSASRPVERLAARVPWWARWLVASVALGGLAVLGPWWWPLPNP